MRYDIVRFKSGGFAVRVTRRELLLFKVYTYLDAKDGREWYTAESGREYCRVDTFQKAVDILESKKREKDVEDDIGEVVSGPL